MTYCREWTNSQHESHTAFAKKEIFTRVPLTFLLHLSFFIGDEAANFHKSINHDAKNQFLQYFFFFIVNFARPFYNKTTRGELIFTKSRSARIIAVISNDMVFNWAASFELKLNRTASDGILMKETKLLRYVNFRWPPDENIIYMYLLKNNFPFSARSFWEYIFISGRLFNKISISSMENINENLGATHNYCIS